MDAVYSRLYDLTADVYADIAEESAALPHVVYRVASAEPQLTLRGPSGLTRYTIQIDTWADTYADVQSLQSEINTRLHGYRGGTIHGSFLQSQSGEDTIDEAFHGVQTYSVWIGDDLTPPGTPIGLLLAVTRTVTTSPSPSTGGGPLGMLLSLTAA